MSSLKTDSGSSGSGQGGGGASSGSSGGNKNFSVNALAASQNTGVVQNSQYPVNQQEKQHQHPVFDEALLGVELEIVAETMAAVGAAHSQRIY